MRGHCPKRGRERKQLLDAFEYGGRPLLVVLVAEEAGLDGIG